VRAISFDILHLVDVAAGGLIPDFERAIFFGNANQEAPREGASGTVRLKSQRPAKGLGLWQKSGDRAARARTRLGANRDMVKVYYGRGTRKMQLRAGQTRRGTPIEKPAGASARRARKKGP
jgi:hypothetical protein